MKKTIIIHLSPTIMKLKNLTILNLFVFLLLISCGSGDDSTVPIEIDDEQLNDTLVWLQT